MRNIMLFPLVLLTVVLIASNSINGSAGKKEKLLCEKKWMFGEIKFVENNQLEYYKRGKTGNTIRFPNDYVIFRKDKTGEYSNGKETYPINWRFGNKEKSSITYTIQMQFPLTVYWEHINIFNDRIIYSEYYTKQDGVSVMGIAMREVME